MMGQGRCGEEALEVCRLEKHSSDSVNGEQRRRERRAGVRWRDERRKTLNRVG